MSQCASQVINRILLLKENVPAQETQPARGSDPTFAQAVRAGDDFCSLFALGQHPLYMAVAMRPQLATRARGAVLCGRPRSVAISCLIAHRGSGFSSFALCRALLRFAVLCCCSRATKGQRPRERSPERGRPNYPYSGHGVLFQYANRFPKM